jgi:hypothetical protein
MGGKSTQRDAEHTADGDDFYPGYFIHSTLIHSTLIHSQ